MYYGLDVSLLLKLLEGMLVSALSTHVATSSLRQGAEIGCFIFVCVFSIFGIISILT